MANFLNTRIRLKYDLYQNWYDKNPTLLEGEVAIAVPGDKLGTVNTAAACLMKVGNGTSAFRDLPWLAAPAADVHEWAKKSETAFKEWLVSENGPHLANQSDLAALKSELNTSIGNVNTALTNYKNTLGFDTPAEGKTVQSVIAETYATKTEVNTLDNKVGYTGTDKTLVKFIEDTYATKSSVATDIATERTRAESIESELATAIANEKTRAEEIEQGLSERIDDLAGTGEGSVDARIKAAIDKEVEERDAAILVETNARIGEITRVEGLISVEESRATGVEGGLANRIQAIEDDYLVAADKTELQNNINTLAGVVEVLGEGIDPNKVDGVKDLIKYVEDHGSEVTGMKEDIESNASAISAEAAIRVAADEALGKRIDDTNTALANYKNDIGFTKGEKTLVEIIAATYATKNELTTAVGQLEEAINTLGSETSGLASRVSANEAKLKDLATGTVVGDIAAAETRAATDAQTKAAKAKDDAIAAAATDATNKADNALKDAKAYTDSEIDKVESTITELQGFDKTAVTGHISGDTITLKLDNKTLDFIFCCGNATV